MNSFNDIINSEIRKAIPSNWRLIPNEKLLGNDSIKIKFAFNSALIQGKSKLINILTLDSTFSLNDEIEKQILNLRNYIISKNCIFVIICEQENQRYHNDISGFESETLKIDSPNYFSLSCFRDKGLKTTIDGSKYEDLNKVIHDIWSGKLKFYGIEIGIQKVNLELMNDECWKCNKPMTTVTGIVFPNKQLDTWNNRDWLYFNHLVSLSVLNSKHAQIIKDYVDKLKITDNSITPVDYRYSNTIKSKYWAAACPHCNTLRGDFHVSDDRMQYLHDLECRISMDLKYYSIELEVDNDLIEALGDGFEGCPHTCIMGWERN